MIEPIKKTRDKIMVFGTFDVLHKGHLNFFKQARALSKHPFLIVSVARDINVKKIKRQRPMNNEVRRLKIIKRSKLVDKAILGSKNNHIPHIVKERPDIIAIGYDQNNYTRNLAKLLFKKGLKVKVVSLKAFKPHLYKSSLLTK